MTVHSRDMRENRHSNFLLSNYIVLRKKVSDYPQEVRLVFGAVVHPLANYHLVLRIACGLGLSLSAVALSAWHLLTFNHCRKTVWKMGRECSRKHPTPYCLDCWHSYLLAVTSLSQQALSACTPAETLPLTAVSQYFLSSVIGQRP